MPIVSPELKSNEANKSSMSHDVFDWIASLSVNIVLSKVTQQENSIQNCLR
jgi:hypothetical protein